MRCVTFFDYRGDRSLKMPYGTIAVKVYLFLIVILRGFEKLIIDFGFCFNAKVLIF